MMEQVRSRREGKVGVIELVNPPRNYMTARMVRELDELTGRWERDPGVRAIVITGGVPDIFITHYDAGELVSGFEKMVELPEAVKGPVRAAARLFARGWGLLEHAPGVRGVLERSLMGTDLEGIVNLECIHRVFLRLGLMDKAVVAAINGECMGGGCELALSCDYALMARGDYRFGLIEALAGIIPGAGGTQRMARRVGQARAIEYMLDGRVFDADEAAAVGLITRSVEADRLLGEAMELAERLAGRSAASVGGVKRSVRLGGNLPIKQAVNVEKTCFVASGFTAEARVAGEFFEDRSKAGLSSRDIFSLLRENRGPELK